MTACTNNAAYQSCMNDIICTQYRFAEEGFKYVCIIWDVFIIKRLPGCHVIYMHACSMLTKSALNPCMHAPFRYIGKATMDANFVPKDDYVPYNNVTKK